MTYPKVDVNGNFPELERNILKFWQENKIFEQSVEFRPAKKDGLTNEFIFYDGPPFANGLPHYGHLLTGFIKDAFARYNTTKGNRVERRFGWDCHGLPAEMGAEKELKISGRNAIMDFGIDKFNAHCRSSVMKYTSEWNAYVNRQARWVDFKNDYKTMDKSFMESVLWAFKELYKKGLLYESYRVMPYSWACETPLSNFETRLDNSYRERADKAITVNFKLLEQPSVIAEKYDSYRIMAWTTTPWTLPSNLALAVGADLDYAIVPKGDDCFIIGKFALSHYAKELAITPEEFNNLQIIKGNDLRGLKYEPLFNYFVGHQNSFIVLEGDFVVEGDGTGVVHLAPGFGEDDQILCEKNSIQLVCPVDNAGKFTQEVTDFSGQQVFDAIDKIIIKLKEQGSWHKTEQYLHNYPHCWRTDTPLIFKAVPSWYVEVTKFKDRMVELNQQINWIPGYVKDGIFGKWLENARDWSISRNRFWGTPIPVWKSDNPKFPRIDVYGSIEELEKDFGVKVEDLHRPYIDNLTRPNPDDPTGQSMMKRVEDVFDCWFESGSMPFAQVHYPFENKEWFETHFPADFIAEYVAQTRGWFYTLMVLGTALFDKPPFKNCICHGVVLDASGQKLSKRLNNYADPMELFEQYGADALRLTMLSSTITKGQDLLIDKEGRMVRDALRLHIKPIWNAYHFFTLYANADGVRAEQQFTSSNVLDQYILSKLKDAVEIIEKSMDAYDAQAAYNAISDFFEVLNNWFIRRSRIRFWKTEKDQDKQSAYNVLYTCLAVMCKASSSLLPLLAEEIYLGLNGRTPQNSVHLQDFPDVSEIKSDLELMKTMDRVRDICSAGLFIRNTENIRVRQPLKKLRVVTQNAQNLDKFISLIEDEVNVKSVEFASNLADYAEIKLNLNFALLGKKLSHKIKDLLQASKQNQWEKVDNNKVRIAGEILEGEEFAITLLPKDAKGAKPMASNDGLVVLDLEISKELEEEGIARDLVRIVQQARKEAGFDVSDRIKLAVTADESITQAINKFSTYISEQTLSEFDATLSDGFKVDTELAEDNISLILSKVA
ncbi:MAG: putative isoleucyl-tRNA synthetase [Rickettsiaceae bacterium]|nr:putative isoleucyl-tRNA synthetase [Rickettsiaceae bacterium]